MAAHADACAEVAANGINYFLTEQVALLDKAIGAGGGQIQLAPESLKTMSGLIKSVGPVIQKCGIFLQVGLLGYMFSKNIKSYYRGDIDGAQCARECSAFLVSAGAGAGGVGLGVTLCAGAGPIGLLLGGLAMGCMASSAAEFFTRRAFDGLLGDDRARTQSTRHTASWNSPKAHQTRKSRKVTTGWRWSTTRTRVATG